MGIIIRIPKDLPRRRISTAIDELDDERTKRDLKVLRLESGDLNKMGLKCLKCPRLFPRRSNWVQHLNYAHKIKIELNTPSAVKRRQLLLEGRENMKQKSMHRVVMETTMEVSGFKKGESESSVQSSSSVDLIQEDDSTTNPLDTLAKDSDTFITTELANVTTKDKVLHTTDQQSLSDTTKDLSNTKLLPFEPSDNSGIMVFTRQDIPPARLKTHLLKPQKVIQGGEDKARKQRERVDDHCPLCGQFFKYKNVYDDHVLKHSDPKPYKCDECSFQSDSRHGLKAHVQMHGIGEKYQCSGCDKMFYNLHRLLKHEKTHQKRDRTHECEICGKAFMEESVLVSHRKSHFKELTACDLCGKKLAKKRMKEHMNLHTAETVYPCDLCDTVYRQKRSLEAHRKFKHGEGLDSTEKHICTLCDQHFANHVTLEKHMLRHNTENKKFTCSQCGQGFFTKAEVCNHEMTHLDPFERPYVCPVCYKTFTKEHSLKAHQLVHNPSKPLKCEMCGKGFRWKNKLKEHMRTHTGERPFQCRYCESMFTDCATRRYHEKKYHPDKALLPSASSKKFTNNDIRAANIQHTSDGRIIISRGSGANAEYIITNEKDFSQKYGLLTESSEADTATATYVLPGVTGDDETGTDCGRVIKIEEVEESELVDNLHTAQLVAVSGVDLEDTTSYIIAQGTSHTDLHSLTTPTTDGGAGTGEDLDSTTQQFVLDNNSLKQIDGETKLIISNHHHHQFGRDPARNSSDHTPPTQFVIDSQIEGENKLLISGQHQHEFGRNPGETSRYVLTGAEVNSEDIAAAAQLIVPSDVSEQNFIVTEGDYQEKPGGNQEKFVVSEEEKVHLLEEGQSMGMFVEGEQYIQLVEEGNQQVQFVIQTSSTN